MCMAGRHMIHISMSSCGSDDDEGRKLRLLSGGRLRVTRVQVYGAGVGADMESTKTRGMYCVKGRDLLPLNPSECSDEGRHRYTHYPAKFITALIHQVLFLSW